MRVACILFLIAPFRFVCVFVSFVISFDIQCRGQLWFHMWMCLTIFERDWKNISRLKRRKHVECSCSKILYSIRRLMGSRMTVSAGYCYQILMVPLYLNCTQKPSVNVIISLTDVFCVQFKYNCTFIMLAQSYPIKQKPLHSHVLNCLKVLFEDENCWKLITYSVCVCVCVWEWVIEGINEWEGVCVCVFVSKWERERYWVIECINECQGVCVCVCVSS